MTKEKLPKIAIVGRPNVGKSSLFNRIAGSRKAIVEGVSGTTRDRIYTDIKWKGKPFTLIDTGGFEASGRDDITTLILKQLDRAIGEAEVILFVTDGAAGMTHQDRELASRLRKASKRIYLVVNKADDKARVAAALEFYELGLGLPYAVSAVNGSGIEKLLDEVAKGLERAHAVAGAIAPEPINVAIVGRPNVGKSSYLNAILNEERAIVHHVAGTTRDATDTDFEYKGRPYRLIDTAGMRHKIKLETGADFYGIVRAQEAIRRSDVAIVLVDGLDGLREDDERVISYCVKEGKAVILAINKWDLTKGVDTSVYKEMLVKKMNAVKNFPVVFMSCKTRKNVLPSLDLIAPLYENVKRDLAPDRLREVLEELNNSQEIRNRRLKFEYLKQHGVNPPRFTLGMKTLKYTNENLRRHIENFLRKACGFEGGSVSVTFEKRPKVERRK